eukprot:403370370
MEKKILAKLKDSQTNKTQFLIQLKKLHTQINNANYPQFVIEELYKMVESEHVFQLTILQLLFNKAVQQTSLYTFLEQKFVKESNPKSLFPYEFINYTLNQFVGTEQGIKIFLEKLCSVEILSLNARQIETVYQTLNWLIKSQGNVFYQDLISNQINSDRFKKSLRQSEHEIIFLLMYVISDYILQRHETSSITIENLTEVLKDLKSIQSSSNIYQYINQMSLRDSIDLSSYFNIEDIKPLNDLAKFIPLIRIIQKSQRETDQIEKMVEFFFSKAKLNEFEIYSVRVILNLAIKDNNLFNKLIEIILKNQVNPSLSLIQECLIVKLNQSTPFEYQELIKVLITFAAKPNLQRNNKFIEYLIMKLYSSPSFDLKLLALSLYCNLSLQLLDNKYFDQLRELVEYEISQNSNSLPKLTQLLGIMKMISCQGSKTEYSEKFLDIIEKVLSKLNKSYDRLNDDEYNLATLCLSIITDMIDNQILEHQLTFKIMNKKYELFRSLDLQKMSSKSPLTREYVRYLGCCRWEIEDLELENRQINLIQAPKTEEVEDAMQIFTYVNSFVFREFLNGSRNIQLRAQQLTKFVDYIFEYGIQVEILKELSDSKITITPQNINEQRESIIKEERKRCEEIKNQIYQIGIKTKNTELIAALIKNELKQKVETKQLRNIDFSNIQKDSNLDTISQKVITQVKDILHSKKGKSLFDWTIIPTVILDTFESARLSNSDLVQILMHVQKENGDLTKMGDLFSNILKFMSLSNFDSQSLLSLLQKYVTLDNNLVKFFLAQLDDNKLNQYLSPKLLTMILIDLVKYYIQKPESHQFITKLLTILFTSDRNYLAATRDTLLQIKSLLEKNKLDLSHFETLQVIVEEQKLPIILLKNEKVTNPQSLVFLASEILQLLRIQIPKNQKLLKINLCGLFQDIWQSKYENRTHSPQYVVQSVRDLIMSEGVNCQTVSLFSIAFAYLLQDRQLDQYQHYMKQVVNEIPQDKNLNLQINLHKIQFNVQVISLKERELSSEIMEIISITAEYF